MPHALSTTTDPFDRAFERAIERATALRRLAHRLEDAAALQLHRRAGIDTWIGPTPQHCHDDLTRIRLSVLTAAENLRTAARLLELRADQPAAS